MRRLLIRLALVVGSSLVAVGLLEVGLRSWGWFEGRRMAEELTGVDPLHRPIVVFCGDSNIYGVYVEKDETLPAAVERLSRAPGGTGIRCINIGVPGTASWGTLDQVRRALLIHPAAVVVTCGVNNYSIRPPEGKLGILEKLSVVKAVRRMIFNYKVSHAKTTEETKLVLGPNGAPIDGTHKVLADGTGVVTVRDREGKEQIQPRESGGGAELDIAVFAPRLRSDYSAMARAASAAGSHLILATYLAGDDAHFVDISNVMREVAGSGAAGLADCGSAFRSAIRNLYLTSPKGSVTPAADVALRGLLLTRDRHPTPIGYEVEARVVARALAGLGLLGSAPVEDPLEPVSRARVVVPTIRQPDPAAMSFEISGEPGDRVCLLLGIEGDSRFKDEKIDLDWKGAQAQFKIPVPAAPMGEIGNNGKIRLTVPVAQCPPGLRAAAVLERGGPYGAASILVTPTIEIAPRPN